jgi:hypothetical protein
MSYSKKYVRNCILDFMMARDDDSAIGNPTLDELNRLGKYIMPGHVAGFDLNGLVWTHNNSELASYREISPNTVKRVCSLLLMVCRAFEISDFAELKKKSTKIHTSYGLKHSLEHMRRKKGDADVYVSNGEFIGAYLYFLTHVMGTSETQTRSMAQPVYLTEGPNMWMKVPAGFDLIDNYCRGLL